MAEFLCCLPETTTTLLIGCVCVSHSVMFNSLRPYRLWPARLLCPWDSLGTKTGVGCYFLTQNLLQMDGKCYKTIQDHSEVTIYVFCSLFSNGTKSKI